MSDSLSTGEPVVKHRYNRITIRWPDEDLDRLEQVIRLRNERDHSDLNSTDIIRMATRRFLAEELDGQAAA